MEKFIKSIFNTADRKKAIRLEGEEDKVFTPPPLDGRRKLSISRSGRMRQANRKRHSLSLELYGDNLQTVEKAKTVEYHVNAQNQTPAPEPKNPEIARRRNSADEPSPEEEIDLAFKIIDKT